MSELLVNKIKKFSEHHVAYVPSVKGIETFTDNLLNFLFPVRSPQGNVADLSDIKLTALKRQFRDLLLPVAVTNNIDETQIVETFFNALPDAFDALILDAEAILKFDPAANSLEEVITAYPGFYAVAIHRLAHILHEAGLPSIPRIISEYAHGKTGIDIHPGAKIGKSFFIDHGTGVVIGGTAIIGNNVKIYQGVTLGALQVAKSFANTKRHPTLEDNVIIYSGTTILGGDTIIGHDTVVGGNVWLTESVVPFSLVFASHNIKVRNSKEFVEPIDFVI